MPIKLGSGVNSKSYCSPVGTDTEFEPFEGKARTPESSHIVAPPISHVEESKGSGTFGVRSTSSDSTMPLSPDHPLPHTTPALVPFFIGLHRFSEKDEEIEDISDSYSESKGAEDEGPSTKDEDLATRDEGLAAGVKGPSVDDESYGLDDESHGVDDESRSLDNEGPSVEIDGHGLEGEEAVPEATLTTWTYSKDGIVYIDATVYPPPAPPVQTLPSPEWTSSLLPISPSPFIIPSPVSSPVIPLNVALPIDSPMATSTAIIPLDEDQFIKERTTMTFGALWRPILASKAWAGHRFAARAIGDKRSCYCIEARKGP
nr:hypothetical protein [Tanacetum cinerariifolium]